MLNNFLPILILSFYVVCGSAAQTTEKPQFKPVFTDSSNGLSWGQKLKGTYANGCVPPSENYGWRYYCTFKIVASEGPQIRVDESAAAKACRDIGARLPTKLEYESLIKSFDHTGVPNRYILTAKGEKDIQKIFGDMNGRGVWFWTSTLNPFDYRDWIYDDAYIFNGSFIEMAFRGDARGSVRCVVSPAHSSQKSPLNIGH